MFGRAAAALLVGLVAAGIASGCGGGTATPSASTPAPSASRAPSPSAATPTPSVAPSPTPTPVPTVPTVTTLKVTGSGHSVRCGDWKIGIGQPVVGGWPDEATATINAAIEAKVGGLVDAFEKDAAGGGGGGGNCTLDGKFSVAAATTGLLSLRFAVTQFLGGASSESLAMSFNFGSDGTPIVLADLFADPTAGARLLSAESRTRLLTLFKRDGVGAGWIDPGTTPAMSNFDRAWAFTSAGLELTFQELQVAPHALGTPRIVVPWSALAGALKPDGPAAPFLAG